MDKVKLQVGDIFSQAWEGCQKPMWFKVLSIDRTTNSIEVECHSFDSLNVFPEVWSLDSTEAGFEIGDYKLVKMENKERDALIESIYEQVDSLCDKLYNVVWEPQDPTRKNHFDTLPKAEQVALVGLLNDANRFKNSLTMYISWFKHK